MYVKYNHGCKERQFKKFYCYCYLFATANLITYKKTFADNFFNI